MREWDGMDKRDQGFSRPGTGGMSHGIPGYPTAKSDNPLFWCRKDLSMQQLDMLDNSVSSF